MVTAEFAIALLAVLPMMLAVITLTAVTAEKVRAVEAARTAARMLARGQSEQEAREFAQQVLPRGGIQISRTPTQAEVVVEREIDGAGLLPAFTVRGTAVTPLEDPDGP